MNIYEKAVIKTIISTPLGRTVVKYAHVILFFYGIAIQQWSVWQMLEHYPFLSEEEAITVLAKAINEQEYRAVGSEFIEQAVIRDFFTKIERPADES